MRFKLNILTGFFFIISIVLVVLFTYLGNFGCSYEQYFSPHWNCFALSDNKADWGVFGDYIGGILNPLLTLFISVIAYKTYISQSDKIDLDEQVMRMDKFVLISKGVCSSIDDLLSDKFEDNRTTSNILKTIPSQFSEIVRQIDNGEFEYGSCDELVKELNYLRPKMNALISYISVIVELGKQWNVEESVVHNVIFSIFKSHESIVGCYSFFMYNKFCEENSGYKIIANEHILIIRETILNLQFGETLILGLSNEFFSKLVNFDSPF